MEQRTGKFRELFGIKCGTFGKNYLMFSLNMNQ